MKDINEKAALITGASSGFGWEFCRCFARDGHNVIMVARDEGRLQECKAQLEKEFPSIRIEYISQDLANDTAAEELYDKVSNLGLTVNWLINDAGFGEQGNFAENDMEKEMKIIHLNVVAVMQLTKLYLREMLIRNEGRILQVSSILGMIPSPKQAVYAASKAFVHFFSESVQEEIKDTDVTMTTLFPGASDTEFFDRADAENTRIYQFTSLYEPEEVATAGYKGLMNGDNKVIPGVKNKIQAYSSKILPDPILRKVMGFLMEEKDDDK